MIAKLGLPPLVSLIVRAAERREQLAPLLADLRENTDYRPLEVVLVEPGSAAELWPRLEEVSGPGLVRLAAERAESAAAQNNRAARAAHGRVLVFVDPGLRALAPGWLRELVSQLQAAGIRVILMTPPRFGEENRRNGLDEEPNLRLGRYVRHVRALAAELKRFPGAEIVEIRKLLTPEAPPLEPDEEEG